MCYDEMGKIFNKLKSPPSPPWNPTSVPHFLRLPKGKTQKIYFLEIGPLRGGRLNPPELLRHLKKIRYEPLMSRGEYPNLSGSTTKIFFVCVFPNAQQISFPALCKHIPFQHTGNYDVSFRFGLEILYTLCYKIASHWSKKH